VDVINESVHRVLSWARYLCWAEELRQAYEATGAEDETSGTGTMGIIAHYYGSLFVVIEGWEEIGLKDAVIESLLRHPAAYKDLLRRFRNGAFHYRPSVIDHKTLGIMKKGEEHVLWVRALHDEFIRFFREWLSSFKGTPHEKTDLKESVTGILGFIPATASDKAINSLQETTNAARQMLHDHPPSLETSLNAFNLKKSIRQSLAAIAETKRKAEQIRRDRLKKLGILVR
jgi:hypothetical protein